MSKLQKYNLIKMTLILSKLIIWLCLGLGFIWLVLNGFVALLILLPYPASTNVILAGGFVMVVWLVFVSIWTLIDKVLQPQNILREI